MSLISSIFGKAPATATPPGKKNETTPDLFGSKLSVPTILHKKSASATKGKKEDPSGDADEPTKDAKSQSGGADDGDRSSPTAPGDVARTTDNDDSAAKPHAKKTKEELREEEERTVFVGNLPPDVSRRALSGIFKPCGTVVSARLRSMAVAGVKLPPEQAGNQNMMRKVCANTGKFLSDTPKKSAQGYVVFKSAESIEKALQLNNTAYESHTIRVDHASPTVEPNRSVFVGNLPYGAEEESLREHFLKLVGKGEDLNRREGSAVSGVRLVRERETQRCKGFGYVALRDATLVPLALRAHGTTYKKRELRVMVCGKRFKGVRGKGVPKGGEPVGEGPGRRVRESAGAAGAPPAGGRTSERKSAGGAPPRPKPAPAAGTPGGKKRKRRARSEKKAVPGAKSGVSKRAATEQKVNKRVKKLQKRVTKGMGKKKH